MGKKIFIFVFSAVVIFNLSAKEHNFSIGVSSGILSGQAQEIVYIDSKSDTKLSELLWNFKSLDYIGLDVKYSWLKPENKRGLFANGSFKYGFSNGTDIMEDRDWVYIENNVAYSVYPWLTHYSVHDNNTKSAILIDFNFGMSFLIFNKFLIKPYLSYHYMHFSWTASGGSILYPSWDTNGDGKPDGDHLPLFVDYDEIGKYEQIWNIFSPGISFYGEFNRYFDIEIAFEITPLIWCKAIDNHLLRNLVITDSLKGGIFIEPSLLFSYKPKDYFVLSLSLTYKEIKKSRGSSLYKEPSNTYFYINGSGAGYTATDIGIIAKYRF